MALATRCPHCHTTFRVAHDQLKLRAGLVRCGACKEIFNGIEHLLRPEDTPASTPPPLASPIPESSARPAFDAPAPPAPAHEPAPEAGAAPADSDFFAFLTPKEPEQPIPDDDMPGPATDAGIGTGPATEPATVLPAEQSSPAQDDPLLRMTLMDFSDRDDERHDERHDERDDDDGNGDGVENAPVAAAALDGLPDPIDQAIEDLQRKPHRRSSMRTSAQERDAEVGAEAEDEAGYAEEPPDEPSFVKKARRRQRFGPAVTLLMAFGSAFLLLALAAQGAYAFRQQLAARFPQAKPALTHACALAGCRVGLPMRIDALSIESNELQTISADRATYMLSTLLRNRADTVQAWPNIELTLNDTSEKPLVRRVFTPREYLATAAEIDKGFAAGSEQQIRLHFLLSQLKPAGYRVYIFYP